MKPPIPRQAIDKHMGEEEQNRKQKEDQMKETGNGSPTQGIDEHMGEKEQNRKHKIKRKKQEVGPNPATLDQ